MHRWSRTVPTVAVVQERQRVEGQPVRFWFRHTKPDGHGNERYVVEMRVMDGKLFWLIEDEDRFDRWTEVVLGPKYDDVEWAWCVPPDAAPSARIVHLIEWMADQPCKGNGSGMLCRENAPHDPTWCCPACQAWLLRYGT